MSDSNENDECRELPLGRAQSARAQRSESSQDAHGQVMRHHNKCLVLAKTLQCGRQSASRLRGNRAGGA
jgi:hypothetical protein